MNEEGCAVTPPPLDRELAGPLEEILSMRPPSLLPEMIQRDRARIDAARLTDDQISRNGAFEHKTFQIPTADGSTIELLLIRPPGPERRAVALNFHGGGLVAGHNRSAELIPELDRAEELGIAVAAVSYRLAPEHPHPVPVEDCYAALVWLHANADELRLDPGAIIVSGASAGGCLAAAVALLVRERSGPDIRAQMLFFPMLDDRVESASARQMRGLGLWDSISNETGWDALLPGLRGAANVPEVAAPARAENLRGLPPAYVEVGAYESLRDEATLYAMRLAGDGVDVEFHMWGGAFHSFDEWVPDATVSRTAHRARMDWLRRQFIGQPGQSSPM